MPNWRQEHEEQQEHEDDELEPDDVATQLDHRHDVSSFEQF